MFISHLKSTDGSFESSDFDISKEPLSYRKKVRNI